MARREVKCINKTDRPNPWERIRTIGGLWGKQEQQKAVQDIESKTHDYFVVRAGREVAVVVARSRFDNKYLKTAADSTETNNLLELPECA